MEFLREEYWRNSSSGEGKIFSQAWLPKEAPRAILQIAHGMSEHSGRYDHFAALLAENGFAVFANDHIGHGNSAMGHMGTLAMKDGGFHFLLEDMHTLYHFAEEKLKEKGEKLPRILFGHSMGSIAAADYTACYGDIQGLILMGTPAQNPMASFGIWLGRTISRRKGYAASSPFITQISGTKVDPNKIEHCWLSRNVTEVKRYIADPLNGKCFAASSFAEMLTGLRDWGSRDWAAKIPDIPILITAGGADPIGHFGKGPQSYYDRLVSSGHEKVKLQIYPEARHELLHELNQEQVEMSLLEFLKEYF